MPDPSDKDAFVRLLLKHDRSIRGYLRSMLPSANDVDEVMQNASVVAWRKFDQLDDSENFARWLCVIARYEVLMYRRGKARDRLVLSDEVDRMIADEGLEELSLREQQLRALDGCIHQLKNERRELIVKVYSGGESMKSLAASFGKSHEAFYKMVSRIRKDLHRCVQLKLTQSDGELPT
jgi:RNA polymerase sigma-70 factor (ECF subfamily)